MFLINQEKVINTGKIKEEKEKKRKRRLKTIFKKRGEI